MSAGEHDWPEEQKRLEEVTTKISQRLKMLEEEVGDVKADMVNARKHFWDEVSINLSTPDDIVETHINLRQQAEFVSERERHYRLTVSMLQSLTRLKQSPYFGRIDFTEDGVQEVEQIYVGIASFVKEEDHSFLVYDWRAPISSLYYDYGPGPASYAAPSGEITGTMSLKRQYVIRDGCIRLLFDTGVTIGDELLMQVLSRHSDAQMKSIVATIQKEQNRIIRNDRSRMLIVQGAAGSGKTSAALQRVAYILYKYREILQSDQMVLFSPNPLFNSYVSTVLPELGEENLQQTTFQEYLDYRLGEDFQVEDPFSQIEYILTAMDTPGYDARIRGIRYKSSVDYRKALHIYKDRLEREGMIFISLKFENREIVTSDRMHRQFYSLARSIRMANRIELLRDWLLGEVAAFEEKELNEEWVEEEINFLEPEDYQRAYKQLRRVQKGRGVTFDDFETEKELLSRMVVQGRTRPLRKWIKQLHFVDLRALYAQLFEDERLFARISGELGRPMDWPEICQQTIKKLQRSELAYEDATPFLYLKDLVEGSYVDTRVRHVIIDEVQDYTPFQLEFLKRLFPHCKMTALGDLNQAIYAHGSALGECTTLHELYGPEQTEVIRLTRSYRSTREIVEFTRGMLPGGEEIVPFNRRGEKPRVVVASNQDEQINRIVNDVVSLRADNCESIAVICKTASASAQTYSALRERLSLRLVTKYTPTFEKETLVIPAYLAKGMEFDAVIILNGSRAEYSRESERKLFYTACTRAMHRLNIYVLGEPSPFIAEQKPDTYCMESVQG